MDVYIYALRDPRTSDIHYIGVTNNLALRLSQHLGDKSGTPKSRWIQELLTSGVKPEIVELERVPTNQAGKAERKWLEVGKEEGWHLTNSREGGAGCHYDKNTPSPNFFFRFPDQETKEHVEEWAARSGYTLTDFLLEAAERYVRFWEERAKPEAD